MFDNKWSLETIVIMVIMVAMVVMVFMVMIIMDNQSTKRAWSGRKCEKALSRLSSRLSRDGQSADSEKFYKRISSILLWGPEEKHHSTCRVA